MPTLAVTEALITASFEELQQRLAEDGHEVSEAVLNKVLAGLLKAGEIDFRDGKGYWLWGNGIRTIFVGDEPDPTDLSLVDTPHWGPSYVPERCWLDRY